MLVPCVVMYVAEPPRSAGRNATTAAADATTSSAVAALTRRGLREFMGTTSAGRGRSRRSGTAPDSIGLRVDLVGGHELERRDRGRCPADDTVVGRDVVHV